MLSRLVMLVCLLVLPAKTSAAPLRDIPSEIREYVAQFKADAEANNRKLPTRRLVVNLVNTLGEGIAGNCAPANTVVNISRQYWVIGDDFTNKMVVYHELGHCLLDLWEHDDREYMTPTRQGAVAVSLMHWNVSRLFDGCEKEYITGMFANSTKDVVQCLRKAFPKRW